MYVSCGVPQTLQACAGVKSFWLHSALLCRKQQNIRASEMKIVKRANNINTAGTQSLQHGLAVCAVCVCVCVW